MKNASAFGVAGDSSSSALDRRQASSVPTPSPPFAPCTRLLPFLPARPHPTPSQILHCSPDPRRCPSPQIRRLAGGLLPAAGVRGFMACLAISLQPVNGPDILLQTRSWFPVSRALPAVSAYRLARLTLCSSISFQRLTARSASSPSPSTTSSSPSGSVDPSQLPPALREIVGLFQSVPDARTRYKQLLAYAARLPPMDPALKTDSNRVRGCVSQVWVHAEPEEGDGGGRSVRFHADSDAQLTKGLAALLVLGLSGAPAEDVAKVPVEFIELLGIRQSLSPSRNSGLLNMLNLMKRKALEIAGDGGGDFTTSQQSVQKVDEPCADVMDNKGSEFAAFGVQEEKKSVADIPTEAEQLEEVPDNIVEGNGSSLGGGRKERIRESLERALSPVEMEIEDISHLHKGHAGVAGSNGETHFNVKVVSKEFEGKSLLKRHRAVYDLLQDELKTGLHALSIDAKTPSEV